jgi:hypothetical protein
LTAATRPSEAQHLVLAAQRFTQIGKCRKSPHGSATTTYLGQPNYGPQYRTEAPEIMNAIFGGGSLRLEAQSAPDSKDRTTNVWWFPASETGKPLLVGYLVGEGAAERFEPTRRALQERDRSVGEQMASALDRSSASYRSGYWVYWHRATPEPTASAAQTRTSYWGMVTYPHGGTGASPRSLLNTALGDSPLSRPLSSTAGAKGGLALSWTSDRDGAGRLAPQGKRVRHRLIFRPDHYQPSSTTDFDRIAAVIIGGQEKESARYETEVFTPGTKRERQVTRREGRQTRGWIKDQFTRWKTLRRQAPTAAKREKRVAEEFWQIGFRYAWPSSSETPAKQPRVDRVPPNVMIATLLGRGKMKVGEPDGTYKPRGAWSPIYFETGTGARHLLGHHRPGAKRGRFRISSEMEQRRNQFIGEIALKRVVSRARANKGYGWDADKTFTRYPQKVLQESAEPLRLANGTTVPTSREVEITDAKYHVVDSISGDMPKALNGLLRYASGTPATIAWRSNTIPLAGETEANFVAVPRGMVAEHRLSFARGAYKGQYVTYGYKLVPEAVATLH